MHVALMEFGSHGHHTSYASRTSRYLLDAGHPVTFITSAEHDRLDEFPGDGAFSVERIRPPIASTSSPARWLRPAMNRTQPAIEDAILFHRGVAVAARREVDVLHCPSVESMEFPLWLAGRQSPPFPILATVHWDHYEIGLGLDTLNNLGLRAALGDGTLSTVFVHAEPMAIRMVGTVPTADGRNVEVLPYPTRTPAEELSRAAARERLDLPRDPPLLLFFGGHRYEQGPDLLLEAVRGFDEPVGVVFAGSPGAVTSDDLEAFQSVDGGEARIVDRIGWVPEEDLYSYFVAADATVLPFRRIRGVSETLNRACLTGTHPIASDDTDVGYQVERYDLGQTFDRGSASALRGAIRRFLRDRANYPRPNLDEFGRGQLYHRTGERLEEAYRQAIDRS